MYWIKKTKSDWEGEYTSVRGYTVIDYVFINKKMLDKVIKFKIKERVGGGLGSFFNHRRIRSKRDKKSEEKRRKKKRRGTKKEIICWDKKARKA